ncbi:MAG: hypothetical protein HY816_20030 [Candidatus Wallbacteria bacterium]|nr:hypothetical protein [Candidatus Wallbacteria bacterium]
MADTNNEINGAEAIQALEAELDKGLGDAGSAEAVTKSLGLVERCLDMIKGFGFGKRKDAKKDAACANKSEDSENEDEDDMDLDEEAMKSLRNLDLAKSIEGMDAINVTDFLDRVINEQRAGMAALHKLTKSVGGKSSDLSTAIGEFVRQQTAVNDVLLKSLEVITRQQEAFFARVPTTAVRGVPGALSLNLNKALPEAGAVVYTDEQLLKGIQSGKINRGHVNYYRTTGKLPPGVVLD